ncbi:MAG: hypothetical protein EZS28_047576, partial [Streblomastix strix]
MDQAELKAETFDIMRVIMSGGQNLQTEEKYLHILTNLWSESPEVAIPINVLIEWLSKNLQYNSDRYPQISLSQQALLTQSDGDTSREWGDGEDIINQSPRSPHIMGLKSDRETTGSRENLCPIQMNQNISFLGCPLIVSVNKLTSMHAPREPVAARILACSKSHIYILGPVQSASVLSCESSTIFIGAVATVLSISNSSRITVIAAAGRVKISNSSDVIIHTLTPSPILLTQGCRGIVLAPYNAIY